MKKGLLVLALGALAATAAFAGIAVSDDGRQSLATAVSGDKDARPDHVRGVRKITLGRAAGARAAQRGPRGPRGRRGPRGLRGPGSTFTRVIGPARQVAPNAADGIVLFCGGAGSAIAGGFSSDSVLVFQNENSPGDEQSFQRQDAWQLNVTNVSNAPANWTPTVTCVR